ncbi:MAG: efflux RND transporter periplasmic adaptor subunit, partial [Alphaproteobacteria bacterium]|nr:efflux RND transporter periplasmic adaptor subunit [Alphaproteobacteria bacterium]
MLKSRIVVALIATAVASCDKPAPPTSQARPVRAVAVERHADGETVSLTGHIRAKDQANLAFRLDGRMIARPVNVGDVLTAGQVVAKLDPQIQQNGLNTAQANLASVEAVLTQARLTFGRQQQLIKNGWTSVANFDEARQKLETTQGQVDAAQAQLRTAQEQLGYTVLSADAPGVVTTKGAEAGEVVHAGQMIVQVARQGGRDAVFDAPEQLVRTGPRDPLVEIARFQPLRDHDGGRIVSQDVHLSQRDSLALRIDHPHGRAPICLGQRAR